MSTQSALSHAPVASGPTAGAPVHVAIIMDGNGRWAKARKLPRAAGHKCGHVFSGDGQFFIQPNNRVLWLDGGSFIAKSFPKKPDWKVFSQEFSCESTGSRWVSESDEELWFYEFKDTQG